MTKKDIVIKIDAKTRKVYQDDSFIGVQRENLQNKLIFEFLDSFVVGTPRVLVEQDGNTFPIDEVSRVEDTYQMEIKSSLLKTNEIKVQLMITEQGGEYVLTKDTEINLNKTYFTRNGEEGSYTYNVVENPVVEDINTYYELVNVPIFLSKQTTLLIADSIDATGTIPEEYTSWITIIEEKLAEVDEKIQECENLNIEAERVEDGVEITFTRKDGTQYTEKVNDGAGSSASINGVELTGNKTSADLKICDMPQGYDLPEGQFDGQLFYLIPRQSEAQDTRGLYKFNGSAWHLIGDLSAGIIEINAESHTTINGYEVPVLTDEQIADANFGVKAGRIVLVIDDIETRVFRVLEARNIENTEIAITLLYDDTLILTYQIGRDIKFNDISMKNAYESIKRIGERDRYLYETNYGFLDYEKAKKYYDELEDVNAYACSTIVKGNTIGRNFDYTFDNQVEFVVKTSKLNGRYASIGIAGQVGLDEEFVLSGEYSKKYEIVPFNMQDGINEKGLFASIHIVPQDNGMTTGTIVEAREEVIERINALMLVRYALDNFATVDEVVEATEEYLSIYVPQALRDKGYEVHFLFSDKNKTYVLEFINNVCEWTDISDYPVLTNFFIEGVQFPSTHKLPEIGDDEMLGTELTERSMGIERYNDLIDGLLGSSSVKDILESVKYTNTYNEWSNEAWASEYAGTDGLTVYMTRDSFVDTYLNGRDAYLERTRENPITNQTIHSSIYDVDNKKLTIYTQENYGLTDDFIFDLPIEESGTIDYSILNNKPKINNVELNGNKTSADLGLQDAITSETTLRINKAIFGNYYVNEETLIQSAEAMAALQPIIINASSNTTVNGYQVPVLTTDNIQAIYNGIVAGKEVVVSDATGNMHFKVNQADSVSGEIFISFLYYDIMLLEYDENATINFKEFASKTYVDNAIFGAMDGEY